jgi:hypothetical protein
MRPSTACWIDNFTASLLKTVIMSPRFLRRIMLCWLTCGSISSEVLVMEAALTTIHLKTGTLHVPEACQSVDGRMDLFMHLHGASATVERNILQFRKDTPWVSISLPGLSSAYSRYFKDPAVWPALKTEVLPALTTSLQASNELSLGTWTLSSFSAGYGGVRELLKQPTAIEDLDTLLLLDSLYAGWQGDPSLRQVNPEQMAPFVAFARLAMAGKKRMLISHTRVETPDYASTAETAAYLTQKLHLSWAEKTIPWATGMTEWRRTRRGNFQAFDFGGDTGEAHLNHLRHMALFFDAIGSLTQP